jgi:hypothetical protein
MRILCVCICAVLFAASAFAEEWTKKFQVTGQPELRVEADDADVVVRPGAGNTIEARLTTRGWTLGPGGVRVTDAQTGNRVEIVIRMPRENWSFGRRSARLEVTVPRELRADIHTGDGGVNVAGLAGEFRLSTGDGPIGAESLEGALTAKTGDGAVTVRGRFGLLDLRTGDGSISALVEAGSKMTGPWHIRTGDGSVTVKLAPDFAADLEAHTSDGGLTVDLPLTTGGIRTGENTVRGKLNGGGQLFRIETGDGGVRIGRL